MRLIVRSVFAAVALALLVVARAPAQEPVTITGKVTSDGGLPLGQVEVAIPVMGLGALSKDDGAYTIVVPGARVSGQTVTLVSRRLGYKAQSAQVTLAPGGVTHDFVLAANPLQLGEVVVTGAGTTSSTEKLGNVRNSVGADLIAKAGEANMVQALAGKAPNVTVVQQSGDPGAGSYINIRGTSSILGSNQPLFVVDGVADGQLDLLDLELQRAGRRGGKPSPRSDRPRAPSRRTVRPTSIRTTSNRWRS